ncbi:MAG: hypothetical protein Q8P57_05315 [Candidatus Pacearchaeota archaeon]|nr:hypothetical protein [Candidatus Pacearchaeota archaeon]
MEYTKKRLFGILVFSAILLFSILNSNTGVGLSPSEFGYKFGIFLMACFVLGLILVLLLLVLFIYYTQN